MAEAPARLEQEGLAAAAGHTMRRWRLSRSGQKWTASSATPASKRPFGRRSPGENESERCHTLVPVIFLPFPFRILLDFYEIGGMVLRYAMAWLFSPILGVGHTRTLQSAVVAGLDPFFLVLPLSAFSKHGSALVFGKRRKPSAASFNEPISISVSLHLRCHQLDIIAYLSLSFSPFQGKDIKGCHKCLTHL